MKEEYIDLCSEIVSKGSKMGFEDVICGVNFNQTTQVRFANNDITITNNYETARATIFGSWHKRLIYSEIDDFKQVDETLETLMKLAKAMRENQNYVGIAKPSDIRYAEYSYDSSIPILKEKLLDYAHNLINATIKAGAKRTAGVLYTNYAESYLASSTGIQATDTRSYIEASVRGFVEKDSSGHGVTCATKLSELDIEGAAQHAGEVAKAAINPKDGDAGKFNVIFHPIAFANLLTYIGMCASAFLVESGLSFFKDKISKEVGSEIVTLYDDGILPEGLGSKKFDDEGAPRKRTLLIENGILKTYLHNTSTATKYNVPNTNNAGVIVPQPWNIILKEGDLGEEELFKDLKNGLYITNLWYTRFQNYQTGDFSTIPRDGIFIIKNGELAYPIKNIRISDNLQRLLLNIKALSSKSYQIHWWEVDTPTFTPFVRIDDVSVTKSTA